MALWPWITTTGFSRFLEMLPWHDPRKNKPPPVAAVLHPQLMGVAPIQTPPPVNAFSHTSFFYEGRVPERGILATVYRRIQ